MPARGMRKVTELQVVLAVRRYCRCIVVVIGSSAYLLCKDRFFETMAQAKAFEAEIIQGRRNSCTFEKDSGA